MARSLKCWTGVNAFLLLYVDAHAPCLHIHTVSVQTLNILNKQWSSLYNRSLHIERAFVHSFVAA